MIHFLRPLRALARILGRAWGRRAARKLLAERTPRGALSLPPPGLTRRVAAAAEAPPGEYRTVPLGAQAIRGVAPARLLRLSALPAAPRELSVLRAWMLPVVEPRADIAPAPRLPRLFELGVARPDRFRLDAELRLPPERDAAQPLSPAPVRAPRPLRPRTPLARAPLSRVDPRAFRLDPRSHAPANEGIVPLHRNDPSFWWLVPAFREKHLDTPWMAKTRLWGLGPLQTEWFVLWWDAAQDKAPGAREAKEGAQPDEIYWALQERKEQMLIRRDVKKDENPPKPEEFYYRELGLAVASHEAADVPELIPPKILFEPAVLDEKPELRVHSAEVYLEWRTLLNALDER